MSKTKIISTIVMTLSTIFSPHELGLRYAQTAIHSIGHHHHISGEAQLKMQSAKTLAVNLSLHGLSVGKYYQILLCYGDPLQDQKTFKADPIGNFIAKSGKQQVRLMVHGVSTIPEMGWSLVIRPGKAILVNRMVTISKRDVVASGNVLMPGIHSPIIRSGVAGADLVVLTIGPRVPVQLNLKANNGQNYEVYAPGNKNKLVLRQGENRVNVRVGIHVYNLKTGQIVQDVHPIVYFCNLKNCKMITVSHMPELYSSVIGMPDLQYVNDTYLPIGIYRADITLGKAHLSFSGLSVTSATGLLFNPASAAPKAIIREQNGKFNLTSVTVNRNSKVEFVYAGKGTDQFVVGNLKSPMLFSGQSWTLTVQLPPGRYNVHLAYAPEVKMTLKVV